MKTKRPLRLYVWQPALTDYSDGVMFALARSPEHARKLILKKVDYVPEQEFNNPPRVVTKAEGFAIYGGG